jgi:hypothetical protein
MSAIRLPLLYAFAGGCLSNAVLFGLWRVADSAGAWSPKQQHRSDNVVELVTPASAAPIVEQPRELVALKAAEQGRDPATEPAPTTAAQDPDSVAPPPAGSAVSDVLMGLETAYRERVAARAPAPTSSTQERAAAPAETAIAAAEPARAVPAQPVADVIPPVLPVAVAAPVAAAAPVAVEPAVAPPVPTVPAFLPQDAAQPSQVQYGDVNQNTYITNIRQGDVYLIQMQQIAMLQYMQLLGMSSGVAAPARHSGGAGPQRTQFPSGITNPDNPWGFRFSPPHLVR